MPSWSLTIIGTESYSKLIVFLYSSYGLAGFFGKLSIRSFFIYLNVFCPGNDIAPILGDNYLCRSYCLIEKSNYLSPIRSRLDVEAGADSLAANTI